MTWVNPVRLVLSSWFFLSGFHFELPLIVPHPACLLGYEEFSMVSLATGLWCGQWDVGEVVKLDFLSYVPQSGRFQYRSVLEALTTIASTDGPRGM